MLHQRLLDNSQGKWSDSLHLLVVLQPCMDWRLIVGSYHIFTGKKGSILPYASQVVQDGIPSSIQYISQTLETSEKPDMQSLQYAAEMRKEEHDSYSV